MGPASSISCSRRLTDLPFWKVLDGDSGDRRPHGDDGMTLHGYLKVFRHRWRIHSPVCDRDCRHWIVNTRPDGRYSEGWVIHRYCHSRRGRRRLCGRCGGPTPSSLARIALYVTTGEIPRLAAESLG